MKSRYITNAKASTVLFAALFCSYTFIAMTKQCFSSAMAFIKAEGTMTASQVGTIVALFYLVYGFLQIAGGIVTDKWRPEPFITFGFLGAGACNLLVYFFYRNYIAVLIIWVLNAVAQFAVWPAVFKLISGTMKREQRVFAIFFISFANSFGTVVNYAVAALIPHWTYNFLFSAIGLFAFALIWQTVTLFLRPYMKEEETENKDTPAPVQDQADIPHISTRSLLFSSGIIFFLAVPLVRAIFDNGLKSLAALMIENSYDSVSPTLATALTVIILVMGSLGPILGRIIYPRLVKNEITASKILFALCVPLVCSLLLLGRADYRLIVALLSLLVLLMNSSALFASYMTARFSKWGKSATVAGAMNAMASLGIVVSNFVFTRMSERFGWTASIDIWIGLILFSNILLWLIAPMWKRFLRDNYCE